MARKKITRRSVGPKGSQQEWRGLVVDLEDKVSRVLSEISIIQMVLLAKKKDGGNLDTGEISCIFDVLVRAQADLINIEWPLGLTYKGSIIGEAA
jgi:hypothetical protein